MAQQEIKVPDLGGIDEVEVIELCVTAGDQVEEEAALVVLESDKASMEVPSSASGQLVKLTVAVGDMVSEGSVIAILETDAQSGSDTATNEDSENQKGAKAEAGPATTSHQDDAKSAPKKTGGNDSGEQTVSVTVPDLGGIDSVEVIEISVKIGDTLDEEASLLVVESDKATMEIPASHAGEVLTLEVNVGDTVKQGDLVATMKVSGGKASATEAPKTASKPAEKSSSDASESKPSAPAPTTNESVPQDAPYENTGTVHAGPAVRRLARELGVNLSHVKGSGPKGRVVKEDLHAFVKQKVNAPASAQGGPIRIEGSKEDFSKHGPIEEIPLNKIKQVTARNMVQSWTTIPQVTQFDEADITELEHYRKNSLAAQTPEGVKVTPLAFVVKATQKALQKFPQFNASLSADGTGVIQKGYYNIGVAVDTPEGLLVPSIKGVDGKGLVDIAQQAGELAKKARDKKLPMDAMQGTSFTISSLGGIGGTNFTPIVNAPQVAILGVSKASYKPVWNGKEFEPRLMLPLAVSYDHRVIDGAEAARFTRYLCELLSEVRHLLL